MEKAAQLYINKIDAMGGSVKGDRAGLHAAADRVVQLTNTSMKLKPGTECNWLVLTVLLKTKKKLQQPTFLGLMIQHPQTCKL